jgi:hypothetical protein
MPEPIFEPGPVPTPFVYTVSGTGEVVPRACQAVYDGTGAGGDYVPAVIFRSQAGHVISRAILQSTVTAGDDAEVSWFPGVKAAAASSSALEMALATSVQPFTILNTGGVVNQATVWDSVATNSATYTWPSGGDNTKIGFGKPGLYAIWITPTPVATWPAPATGFVSFNANFVTYGLPQISGTPFLNTTTSAIWAGNAQRTLPLPFVKNLVAADDLQFFGGTSVAANFAMSLVVMVIVRLGGFLS